MQSNMLPVMQSNSMSIVRFNMLALMQSSMLAVMQADELSNMLSGGAASAVPSEVVAGMKRLFEFLGDATSDAASFAQQARDDAKRHLVPVTEATSSDAPVRSRPLSHGLCLVLFADHFPREMRVLLRARKDPEPCAAHMPCTLPQQIQALLSPCWISCAALRFAGRRVCDASFTRRLRVTAACKTVLAHGSCLLSRDGVLIQCS